ncbi:MAG: hypothetical protein AAF413_01225 [Patescibacteria group bacterium]
MSNVLDLPGNLKRALMGDSPKEIESAAGQAIEMRRPVPALGVSNAEREISDLINSLSKPGNKAVGELVDMNFRRPSMMPDMTEMSPLPTIVDAPFADGSISNPGNNPLDAMLEDIRAERNEAVAAERDADDLRERRGDGATITSAEDARNVQVVDFGAETNAQALSASDHFANLENAWKDTE